MDMNINEIRQRRKSGKPIDCTVCGKVFYRNEVFRCHMRIHSGVKPFSCHICGKTFSHQGNRNQHVLLHTKANTLSCKFCDHTSFSQIYLNRHVKRSHPEHYIPSSRGQVPIERRSTRESNIRTFHLPALSNEEPTMPLVITSTEDKVYIPQNILSQICKSEVTPQNPGSSSSSSPIITCNICHDQFAVRSKFQLHLMMHELQDMNHSSGKNGLKASFTQIVNRQNMNVIMDPLADSHFSEEKNENQEYDPAVLVIKQEPS